ncbi:flavin reductase family protein [Aminobacter aminovorans]|uniref:4-hydroxyphenylacetate 3-monooxygenase, reductase component n=1 Tax=Aminobacter aminovorans TaxID=83263 RepID=A0AAC8YWT4_AMIAI|nr:flavin reductase family protein [Aminobacter aminovorans]AMS45486.1 4-hydroxyphenylacetate 3-monooxygenase, reductase component [Aminobacter aminovorans]MBB3708694.1 flavin reductase (DIM6/NTAB) family NADH-FMN oxidoreductase RutF [Aminobacter aminovorans]
MSSRHTEVASEFRNALRGMAASVTIITTADGFGRSGMVATAVMSVSMEPPSLVIAVNKSASIHPRISARGSFCVNILSEWEETIASGFASAKGEGRFAYGAWASRTVDASHYGMPHLVTAEAAIFCKTSAVYDAHGTHSLFVGEVIHVERSGAFSPLTYCNGRYGTFNDDHVRTAHTVS